MEIAILLLAFPDTVDFIGELSNFLPALKNLFW
jgi:hypothetical protein